MLLRLTQDATTITLSGDGAVIAGCSYVPGTPKLIDPGDIISNRDVTVTESAEVVLTGTAAQIVAQVRAIEALLTIASRWQLQQPSKRAYVNYRAETSGDTYRSMLVAGRVEFPADALTPRLASGAVAVLVAWERVYFWEGNLTNVGLKRTGVSKTTSGVTVYNHHDSTTHENFVDIEGADIGGALPSPLKIILAATGNLDSRRFYLSGNVFASPSTFTAIHEGEDSTGVGTPTVDANSSGGNYMARSWTPSIAHSTNAFIWTLAAADLDRADGNWFRVLMRLASAAPSSCYARIKIGFPYDTPLTTLWQGPEILLDTTRRLQDLGAVQIPPGYREGSILPDRLALVLSLRHAGASQLDLDYLQLSGPGVHRFDQQGYQLVSGDEVIVDGPNGAVYIESVDGVQPLFSDYPPPLLAWPGRDMRIRLLFDETSGNSVISRTMTVQAQYRPRRLTV